MRKESHTGRNVSMLMGGMAAGIIGSKLLPPIVSALTGSGRVRAGGDPFALLIKDHRKICSLLQEMKSVPMDSTAQRSRLFLMLKRKLAKHAMAEEDVVYPIVHSQGLEGDESKHLYDEHADMKIHLFELEAKLKNGEDWSTTVASLTELVQRHVEEEEQTIFPRLRQQLAESRLPQVSAQISREEAMVM